jgi:hypothetical protein
MAATIIDHQQPGADCMRFRPLPGSLIFHATTPSILKKQALDPDAPEYSASDLSVVWFRLLDDLGKWSDSFKLFGTPNGGQQRFGQTRIFEICKQLELFGFSVVCGIDRSHEREHSFDRICWRDEVSVTATGRKRTVSLASGKRPGARVARRRPMMVSAVNQEQLCLAEQPAQLADFARRERGECR